MLSCTAFEMLITGGSHFVYSNAGECQPLESASRVQGVSLRCLMTRMHTVPFQMHMLRKIVSLMSLSLPSCSHYD